MRYILFLLAFVCIPVSGDEWSPPDNADPSIILDEASADFRAERYEDALAKHVWFHHNALSTEPSLYGVRLSFALMYWSELAKKYPPALAKLKEIRDESQREILAGKNVRESFHDLASINRYLNEQSSTKDLFVLLDQEHPETAKQAFNLAKSSLVNAKAYSLYAKYVSPKDNFAEMRLAYLQGKKMSTDARFGPNHLDFSNTMFANATTTLVAILAVNDREKESKKIADSARAEWDDPTFHAALDKALQGVVPDPWP